MKSKIIISGLLLVASSIAAAAQTYHDMADFPIYGTLSPNSVADYQRLPDSLKNVTRTELWNLGRNTAGMSIRFVSDATKLTCKWTNTGKISMNHMCPTGIRGIDLYVLMDDDTWSFVGSARPNLANASSTSTFIDGLPKQMREYMLFLPLYDGVESLSIGTNPGAVLQPSESVLPKREKPIVMYGTSILQGGCASRPGMAHTNILQRLLNREVINLGFSGNAHLDPEIAQLMAQADAAIFVLDMLPNNTAASLTKKLPGFYEIIRKAHPDTPIMLVESPEFPRCRIDPGYKAGIKGLNNALKKFYDSKVAEGDTNIYYFKGEDIVDLDGEGTVDGVHFTDLGFQNFADAMYPALKAILEKEK